MRLINNMKLPLTFLFLGPFLFWEKGFEEIESRVEFPLRDELELHHFAFLLGLAFVEAARVANHREVSGP